uniref:Uncharacterized protein n=1 Tax=Oryza sativa subsp. japonica TaxID=39947 RepID=Q7XHM5_ORYSJ|nr:hypothetical protein [Oryza sativa Japonica Group]
MGGDSRRRRATPVAPPLPPLADPAEGRHGAGRSGGTRPLPSLSLQIRRRGGMGAQRIRLSGGTREAARAPRWREAVGRRRLAPDLEVRRRLEVQQRQRPAWRWGRRQEVRWRRRPVDPSLPLLLSLLFVTLCDLCDAFLEFIC